LLVVTDELTGKTAIVTGASRGIGKQVAVELARRGASVVVAARTVEARRRLPGTIGETLAEIESTGASGLAVTTDMSREEDLQRLVDAAVSRYGRIDILINNAAATTAKGWGAPLSELTREDWMYQYSVNLHAPFSLIKAVAPIMAATGGGVIVNLTTAGHRDAGTDEGPSAVGLPTPLAYPSSKAALDQFCRSVAPELRHQGIAIANVHPGFVRTELTEIIAASGVDTTAAIPVEIPTRAIVGLVTCKDRMLYTGQVLVAEELLKDLQDD
jgi:NAD(P)-dependent dehydrogenase (short-subunit alcohol dehydrogenase family)